MQFCKFTYFIRVIFIIAVIIHNTNSIQICAYWCKLECNGKQFYYCCSTDPSGKMPLIRKTCPTGYFNGTSELTSESVVPGGLNINWGTNNSFHNNTILINSNFNNTTENISSSSSNIPDTE